MCLVYIGKGSEVVQSQRTLGDIQRLLQIGDIANHHLLIVPKIRGLPGIEYDYLVPGIGQAIRNMAAQKTAATKNHNFPSRHG